MAKTTTSYTRRLIPPAVAAAARAFHIAPDNIRAYAVRANGEVVVIDHSGRKFVTVVERSDAADPQP